MPRNTTPRCPSPQPQYDGSNMLERSWRHALASVSKLWRPSNTQEITHCTVARYAMHLIDLGSGVPYTAQQIMSAMATAPMDRTTEEGPPESAVANFYETDNGGGGNKDIRFVQVDDGTPPTVVLSAGSFSTPISVAVSGRAITVTCPTAIGQITTTAAGVISAINASGAASAILTASNKTGSDGSENMANSFGPWELAGGVAGTPADALGQQCFVNSSDVYVCTRLSPVKWAGPLNQ